MTADLVGAAEDALVAALSAVDGTKLVQAAVRRGLLDDWLGDLDRPNRIQVLALGKVAPAMLWGLVEAGVPFRGMGVAPRGVRKTLVDTFEWHTGDHPVPGEASFAAGAALLDWVDRLDPREPLLVLLSGGASACVEVPAHGIDGKQLQQQWQQWLMDGSDIASMNAKRTGLSQIKGGQLGRRVLDRLQRLQEGKSSDGGSRVQVWLLADTPPPEESTVGSGPFALQDQPIAHHVLARNDDLVQAAGQALAAAGFNVYLHGARIAGPVEQAVEDFLGAAAGLPQEGPIALVGGGEADVALPETAPPGGRAQHAALLAARHLAVHQQPALFMATASDGKDGQTDAAGAWATARTWLEDPSAQQALESFDAHRLLDKRKQLLRTGGTRTNLNDLWIALKTPPNEE